MEQQEAIKKSIVERFNNLQPEIQAAIMDPSYEKNLYDIAQKYKMSDSQIEGFEANTTLVMLGQINPDDYSGELMNDLSIQEAEADKIVGDVKEKILNNSIYNLLKNNFEEENDMGSKIVTMEEKENIINSYSDKIPLPPYSRIKTDRPEPIQPLILKREEPLKVPEVTKNILEDKLNNITVSKNTVSDHSTVSKIANTPTPSKGGDPYREEI